MGRGFRRGPGQCIQGEGEILGGLEALLGLLLQAAAHDALQSRRDGMVHLAVEGALPRNHFVEHGAEGKNVGARIDNRAAHLLRSHIADGAHHYAGFGGRTGEGQARGWGCCRRVRRHFGEAEIQNLCPAFLSDKNVVGLQIAMNDVPVVSRRQSLRDLRCVLARLARRQRTPIEFGA